MILTVGNHRSNFTSLRGCDPSTETTGNERTTNPRGQNGSKVELQIQMCQINRATACRTTYLDWVVSPLINLSTSVNESLDGCGVNMGPMNRIVSATGGRDSVKRDLHSGEVEDDGVQNRLPLVLDLLLCSTTTRGARVVPRTVTKLDVGHIPSAS